MATELTALEDEELMALIAEQHEDAYAVLVRRYANQFYATAYRFVSHVGDAEDIVQDAFISLWQKPMMWKSGKAAFTTWFYKIIVNRCLDYRRKKRPDLVDQLPDIAEDEHAIKEAIAQERQHQAIELAIRSLPERQQTALNLCFYDGLSNKEAADIMGVNVKALESLLMRAKTTLRSTLAVGKN